MANIIEEDKLLRAISELKRPENLKKLYSYAHHCNATRALPPDREPEDLVHEAIELLLSGQRKWDTQKCPDVMVLLKGIVRSLYSHAWELAYHRTRKDLSATELNELRADSPAGETATSDTNVYADLRGQIEAAIGDDEELMEVYFAIVDGCERPRQIVEHLGLEAKEVNARLRRLRRKCRGCLRREVEE